MTSLLLDTHALLWWLGDNPTLSKEARSAISEGRNRVFVSVAAVWEIVIKKSLGKLNIPYDLEKALEDSRFFPLAVTSAHALAVENLEDHHQDPFDRIQVAQAKSEGLIIVTRDDNIKKYDISFISA